MYKILFFIGIVSIMAHTSHGHAQDAIILNNGKVVFNGSTGETVSFSNFPMEAQTVQSKNKNPVIAFALSAFVLPGAALGQFYNGQYKKGGVFLLTAGTGMVMAITNANLLGDGWSCVDCNEKVGVAGALIYIGSWVGSIIDAPISANRINRMNNQSSSIGINAMVSRGIVKTGVSYRF